MEQPSTRKQQHCFERPLPPRKHLRFAANLLLGCAVFFFFFFYAFGNFPGAPLTQLLQSRPLAYGTLPAFRGRDVPSDTFPRVTHTFPTDPGAVGPAAGGRAKTNAKYRQTRRGREQSCGDGVSGRCGQQGAGQGWGQPGFPTTK